MIHLPLSGAQKCAVLLLLLDEAAAATLLRGLDPAEVQAVGEALEPALRNDRRGAQCRRGDRPKAEP